MANIGVVSIYDMNNVGNRLQNFALCRALEILGHTPTVIPNEPYSYRIDPEYNDWAAPRDDASGATDGEPESVMATARRLVTTADWWGLSDKARRMLMMLLRTRTLREFTAQHLRVDPRSITAPGDGAELRDDYDTFVVGSDQVWNPKYRFGSPTDFLRFAHPEKRIAYAASFGVAELPDDYVAHYRAMLGDFERISVRERTGAGLVDELVGREADVTLDPTMLVPLEEWHRLADRAPRQSAKPFLGTYILWTGSRTISRSIRSLARSRGLARRELMAMGLHRPGFYGIENFLHTIRDAEVVVTDSFHATLFAILFGTPVRVISRGPGQDDRIESLLGIFGVPSSAAFGPPGSAPAGPLVDDPESALGPLRKHSISWLADAIDAAVLRD